MTGLSFTPAVKSESRLRIALYGPPGGGKTFTALGLAKHVAGGDITKVGVIDTEHGSAKKYVPQFGQFNDMELPTFGPDMYLEGVKLAVGAGYPVLVIDSFSHAWEGEGGILDMQTVFTTEARGNSQEGWNKVKPHEKRLWNGVLSSDIHTIVTLRSRNEWRVWEEGGRQKREIVGLEPIQRKGAEYEFDIVALMQPTDEGVQITVEKSRYPDELPRGTTLSFVKLEDAYPFFERVIAAISAGEPVAEATEPEVTTLVALLEAEGKDPKRIRDVFEAERSRHHGTLPQPFVQKAIEQALRRAETKQEEERKDDGQQAIPGVADPGAGDGAASPNSGGGAASPVGSEGAGAGGE